MTRLQALLLLAVVTSAATTAAQQTTPGALSFEVASIRPNASGLTSQSSQVGKGSVAMTNMRVRAMLVSAYGMRPERIVGAPEWVDQERFDIVAKAPADTSDSQLRPMLRALLAERFRLVARTEMRDQPVYALVVARANRTLGPGLKPSTECDPGGLSSGVGGALPGARVGAALPAGKRACTVITGSDGRGAYITGGARSIDAFVGALQGLTDRPVVDRTGLTGTYDVDLRFSAAPLAAQPATPPDQPDIFVAVQEQLGLRLEPARGPVEFLVVERIERPTPN